MSLPIPLDRNSDTTLQEQIYNYIRRQVLSGAYPPGLRLCSTRELAEGLKVSRNTAVLAYQWLASEGYLETQAGTGTYICETSTDLVRPKLSSLDSDSQAVNVSYPDYVTPDIPYEIPPILERNLNRPSVDFQYARIDPRQFPIKIWRRLISENLLSVPARLTDYVPTSGVRELRVAIADHLITAKGIVADPEQIIITGGAQDAMNLVARLFVRNDVRVGIECPGYASAAAIYKSYGAEIVALAVDRKGVTTSDIVRKKPAIIYTTPSHQFPTGVIMSPSRRQELLAAAEATNACIVEDDYDGEITYDRPPIAALAALDQTRRVIYVGSFAKSLGAGIRIGFMVVPRKLLSAFETLKAISNYGQPWLEQVVLANYISSGSFGSHLRRTRLLYRDRRDAAIDALHTCFGKDISITGQEAGLHFVCTLPTGTADAIVLEAHKAGVGLYSPKGAGVFEPVSMVSKENRLIVGYAGHTPTEIAKAFTTISAAVERAGRGK